MKKIYFSIFLLVLLASTSCRKDPGIDKLSTNPVVVTQYDTQTNFSSYTTFAIPDTVGLADDDPNNDTKMDQADADQLISTIRSNMTSRGYTEVDINTGNPDVVIIPVAVKNLNVSTYYYPGYWWGYYPYYYGWYGYWGGGYYPGYATTYAYQTGTLSIEMFDMHQLNPAGDPDTQKLIWCSYSGGLLNNNPISDAVKSISQSFKQSSYLIR